MSSSRHTLFTECASLISNICLASNIKLDSPIFEDQYVKFCLSDSHRIDADFFIRAQSVGFTCKGVDLPLYYLIQHMYDKRMLKLMLKDFHTGEPIEFEPKLAGDGHFHMKDASTFYLSSVSTGNLLGRSKFPDPARGEETLIERAEVLSNILFTQFISLLMPRIQQYKVFRAADLIARPVVRSEDE